MQQAKKIGGKKEIKKLILLIFLFSGCASYTAGDYAKFGAGALTAMVMHESGHWAVSNLEGNPVMFDGLHWTTDQPASTSIKMAGLTVNAITNEIIMQAKPKRSERDPFWTGLLWAGTFEEFTYPMFRFGHDDFSRAGQNQGFRIMFTTHAITLIWREFWR